jgi:hypothetical protein
MTDPSNLRLAQFREVLWSELVRKGLIPTNEAYVRARQEVTARGVIGWTELRRVVGEQDWDQANDILKRPYLADEPERMLGFGWLLTRFLAAPVGLPVKVEAQVAELGSLANFIVAVYDQFLDNGLPVRDLLPYEMLEWANIRPRDHQPESPPNAAAAVLTALVASYFELLDRMPCRSSHHHVRGSIALAIRRMYEAENALASWSGGRVPSIFLRRKVGLPFVVQGIPAWLGLEEIDRALYAWHLGWTYRVGIFIGWLDDAVDLDDDSAEGVPNLVSIALEGGNQPERLAGIIASRGARCMREWASHLPEGMRFEPVVRDALAATVYSWLGASRWQ